MNDESFDLIEQQIAARHVGPPLVLRAAVLADVNRELRAARWDRRLVRATAALLVIGIVMNLGATLSSSNGWGSASAVAVQSTPRRALVETVVAVAEATDKRTSRKVARQLAAMTGHTLTEAEVAAIDAAIGRTHPEVNAKKG